MSKSSLACANDISPKQGPRRLQRQVIKASHHVSRMASRPCKKQRNDQTLLDDHPQQSASEMTVFRI